ncbi:hypothetical protein H6F46_18965 [Limnothrix sp. FACHB-1083]|uniref:hypothetical protein n=1 Tax=unclassified Limnothrix TaxID=2632864 RepID=UPI0016815A36|nr:MULTISPECIES: hypothetical protein [unclassified Limnothrix]MBD2162769.1 hypothetical protein [Limnothrix sp. FACHB-1083]MBD2193867.1 hypothetical protein [Limnothrix sp. FACHB-1088]
MFIYLHESLASNQIIELYADHFCNIALAAREGNHIVSGDRIIMKLLAESKILGREREVYFTLYNKLQDLNSIRKKLKFHMKVVEDASKYPRSTENCSEQILNISEFSKSSLSQPTTLLGEDEKDARVYQKIAESYLKEKELGLIRINCVPCDGNGDKIGKKFKSAQKQLIFCLGIADSDQEAPVIKSIHGLDGYGNTAKALMKARESNNTARCDIYIIPVRDIENLFFYEVYEYFFLKKKKDDKKQDLSFFKELIDSHSQHIFRKEKHCVLWYADIKNGTRLGKVLIRNSDDQIYQFWIGYAMYLFERSELCNIRKDCIDAKRCSENPDHGNTKEKIKKCQCFITPNLGEILEDIDQYFEQGEREETFVNLLNRSCLQDPILGKVWEEIGEKITAWCCSVEAIRTSSPSRNSNTAQ